MENYRSANGKAHPLTAKTDDNKITVKQPLLSERQVRVAIAPLDLACQFMRGVTND